MNFKIVAFLYTLPFTHSNVRRGILSQNMLYEEMDKLKGSFHISVRHGFQGLKHPIQFDISFLT